jgi:flagellar motor switch protein FliM
MTGSEQERQITREIAETSLRQMQVDISARLPAFDVPMRHLLGLPVGAVLTTGIPTDTKLDITVGGQTRFRAAAGRVGTKLSVRLLDAPGIPAPPPPLLHP